jgi:hypothetical protein
VLIGILIIVVIGAICFWAIDKFSSDRRLSPLRYLVILICLAAILRRVLPMVGIYWLSPTGLIYRGAAIARGDG